MKSSLLAAALLVIPSLAFAGDARPAQRSRPAEKFTDGQKAFDKAMKELLEKYVDEGVSADDLWRGATQGMLEHAGERPWDTLLSPTDLEEMMGSLGGEIVGIGVEIKFDEDTGVTMVRGVLPGSAAEKAGMMKGDQILRIDGKSYKGRDLREVVNAIRGKAGAEVSITFLHEDKVLTKSLRREKLVVQTVTDTVLPGEVGLLTIGSFSEKTPELVKAALERLKSAHITGLVVDLRSCPGGLFEKAVATGELFLPKGKTFVTTVHRGGDEEPIVTKNDPVLTVPLAVLVNEQTASGAEILAGALQESGNARVVGRKTMGKWNVQIIDDLPNHYAIKFTVGSFKTPKGESLDGQGLIPDLEVEMDPALVEKSRRMSDVRERLVLDAQLRVAAASVR